MKYSILLLFIAIPCFAQISGPTAAPPTSNSGLSPIAVTAATDYTIMGRNDGRHFMLVINEDATAICYVNATGSAAYSSGNYAGAVLNPGGFYLNDSVTTNSSVHFACNKTNAVYWVEER